MRFRSIIARWLLLTLVLAIVGPAALQPASRAAAASNSTYRKDKLHPNLRKQIDEAAPNALFTVVIRAREEARLDAVRFRHDDSVAALKGAAAGGQRNILSYLRSRNAQVLNQLWLINAVVARVDRPTLEGLVNLNDVDVVFDNFAVSALPVTESATTLADEGLTWGLEKIQANRVWSELGFTGQGVRVAVLDTGVDINHPDLAGKMHSDNPGDPAYPGGWIEFDDAGNPVASSVPHDSDMHGTHTSGTVLGGNASGTSIGVAPGATLMHGLILPGGGGSFAQVVAGMQWAVQPTDASGNPAGQPANIASMSFGADGLRSEVVEPIRNMYFAGVLPIASIGNCGNGCVGSPGAVYEAFGIGASAEDDSIAEFSSGALIPKNGWSNPPDEWPDEWMKPDISAPGVGVLSTVPGGGYGMLDGTSMAAPHAAGTAALMLSANPGLTPDLVLSTLAESAYWDNRYGEARPNSRYGWGRIDAFEATSRIAYDSGITGQVTDAATGAPLDQAVISIDGMNRSTKSKPDGTFNLVLPAGTYDLNVSRFGYEPVSLTGIVVADGQKATANAALTAMPSGTIQGTVSFARTGYGIPGVTVRVQGIPIKIQAQTDADGAYVLQLPVGAYDLSFTSYGFADAKVGGLAVAADEITPFDISLESLPRVAVVGDVDNVLSRFLTEMGYLAESRWMDVRWDIANYSTVVINLIGKTTPEEFRELVDAAEANGVGLVFTKGAWEGWGIDWLMQVYGDPVSTGFDWTPTPLVAEVVAEHEILPGRTTGERFNLLDPFWDIAWFDGYSGQTLATLSNELRGQMGAGVAVKQNANNRHVLLASLGATWYQGPSQWTQDAQQLFLDAVRWAAKPETAGPKFVFWDLKTDRDTVLWYEPVDVSVGVKNIGEAAAETDVALSVNGVGGPATSVSLSPDNHQTVHFQVQQEPVGSYKLQLAHLTASFRVRPPKVTVNASTLYLPPSGKGKNADPGEPAIPLAGAQVDIVRNGQVIGRGQLDASGQLTFDSTASRDDYTLVVRHTNYGYNMPRHYLLTMPVHVEDDVAFSVAPQAAETAQLDLVMKAKSASHHGSVFVSGGVLGKAAYEFPTGTLVAMPGTYQIANVMAYDVPGAQWAYASDWESRSLAAGKQVYTFGGDLALRMSDVRGQQAPKANLSWGMADGYSHQLRAIYKATAGAFSPANHRVVRDVSTWPATVAATAQSEQKPVLTMTNPAGAIDQTGTIGWSERPRAISFSTEQVMIGEYGLLLQADTGPYMGQLQASAKLLMPARSVSRTLLRPGDTFDVTVIFDAGQSGDLTLTEALPAGFSITRQSTQPGSTAFSGNTWTWKPSGKGSYKPGQIMKVTYTVKVGADVAAGTYTLPGTVAQGGSSRMVAGPQTVTVIR